MLVRSYFLIIILFSSTIVLFGEDLEYITIKKTMLYDNTTSNIDFNRDVIFKIDEGTRVKYIQRPYMGREKTRNGVNLIIGTFEYDNTKYYIDCADLVPANTADTFSPSFISDLNSPNRKTWVPAYYTTVLQSQDRNTVLALDNHWKEHDPYRYVAPSVDYGEEWYERFNLIFPYNGFDISNSALVLNENISFIIRNINKTDNGYIVTVKFGMEEWEDYVTSSLNWDYIKGKDFFHMILCVDGDYMDVYLEDMQHKLTTFVLVDQVFLYEFETLIEGKRADLSKITWPRRAPKQLSAGEECRVLENLRLRESPDTTSAIVTTLEQESKVTILEIGQNTTINEVTAPWIKVQTTDGETGWCFGLYLRETRFEPTPEEYLVAVKSIGENQENEVVHNTKSSPNMPLWAWVAIIGGAVVIAGGVLFIMKRKK